MVTKLKLNKARVIKIKPQTARSLVNKKLDKTRKALKAGVRISKSGNRYTETRANRSDINPKKNYK